ncbi:hypothetical protein FRB96_001658 [Tulasnella sp. 330]|nr:hypothetical protein FRB96_001658 [Tulasnella sp. 330]
MRAAFGHAIQRINSHSSESSDPNTEMGWRSTVSGVAKVVARTAADGYGRVSASIQQRHEPGGILDTETYKQWWDRRKEEIKGTEKVALYPGFAVRRYNDGEKALWARQDQGPFSVEIFIDGTATMLRPPALATRSQKAFLRLAKGFAALPKLPPSELDGNGVTLDTMSLKGDESEEDFAQDMQDAPDFHGFSVNDLPSHHKASDSSSIHTVDTFRSSSGSLKDLPTEELARYHANLDKRLQPFWSSNLANRSVRLTVFIQSSDPKETYDQEEAGPLSRIVIRTDPQGYFTYRFRIDYETLCTYPGAKGLVFAGEDPSIEHSLVMRADLLPPEGVQQTYKEALAPVSSDSSSVSTEIRVTLTAARVRLISDIDDTVKRLDFLKGAKAIFRNTFVHPLEDLIVPGMAEWYTRMSKMGVNFHYVSNSPFEMAAPIQEFFELAGLPHGHVKLKAWGGTKSLIGGLWEDAASRKRSRVIEVLDDFKECRFFLVGDSGEQDLELYSTIAQARPEQILAIFIRDVTSSSFLPILENGSDTYDITETPNPLSPEFSNSGLASLENPLEALTISTDHSHDDGSQTPTDAPMTARPDSFTDGPGGINQSRSPAPPLPPRHLSQGSFHRSGTPPLPPRHAGPGSSHASGSPGYQPSPLYQISPPVRPSPELSGASNHGYSQYDAKSDTNLAQQLATPQTEPSQPRPPPPPHHSSLPQPPGSYFPTVPSRPRMTGSSSLRLRSHRQESREDSERIAAEKKRDEFKIRIEAARAFVPPNVVLRVFKEPEECVEASEILQRLGAQ